MSEITKTKDQRPKAEKITWLFLALVIVAVYFFALDLPLLGPDEPRYSQVAREMYLRGDWITPTLGGANWFEKPALLYWLQIAAYKSFGVSEFAARFGSAIFGLGTIFSLWLLGRKLNANDPNENQIPKTDFANWLALIAASSIGLLTFSRGASFDIILTFPLTASLVCFLIWETGSRQSPIANRQFLIGFYFFIGAAMLAKGLIGIVFPFAIVIFYYLLSRTLPNKTFIVSLIWGTIISLIIAASWYVPMYLTHGWTFIDEFFIQHHFARYTSNKYQHPQPFPFFFWVLPLMTLPWLPFFLAAIWDFFKNNFRRGNAATPQRFGIFPTSPFLLFAFAWLLVPLVFFSFSGSKLPGYILPALPAALILTAEYVSRFAAKSRRRKIVVQSIALATFMAVAAALQIFVPIYAADDTTKFLIETANRAGYADAKILNQHHVAHNAEFYGAGRLMRSADGKLKIYYGVTEIADEIKRQNGKSVLVLVPNEYLYQLNESNLVESQVLGASGESAIVAVKGTPSS